MSCCTRPKSKMTPTPADGFNLMRALYALRTGKGLASDEDAHQRWSECLGCDRFDKGMCGECGCHMSMKVRVAWAKCPIGKWPAVRSSEQTSRTAGSAGDTPT